MKGSLLILSLSLIPAAAFLQRQQIQVSSCTANTELFNLIAGDDIETSSFDQGAGGVRLAEESAIKIFGEVKYKPGQAKVQTQDMLRYTKLSEVPEAQVLSTLEKVAGKILSTGQGIEIYKDPGETLEKFVQVAPLEAIKDAVAGAASAIESNELVFNFLGGDDLNLSEVMDAANEMALMMDIATKAKISFNSMSHGSIPSGTCTVSVISLGEGDVDVLSGVDKSIAVGEVYIRDGVWYTVDEADMNTAIE